MLTMPMKKMTILRIAVPAPLRKYFDYLPPKSGAWEALQPGVRVRIPFGRRELIGIFTGFSDKSDFALNKLKPVLEIIDTETVIPNDILQLCFWAADYYHFPMGEVLAHALPALLRQGKLLPKTKEIVDTTPAVSLSSLSLNAAQETAVTSIRTALNTFQVFLLDGVTGSGKTEVYLQTIEYVLKNQQQVLVLVPEIGLTPQTIQRFRERLD